MKVVSQTYKDNIKQLGKEITYEITYDNTTLGDEDILNANLHYDGGMLKSVMKQLDIELYNDIPIGTELNYKFGVKVDDDNYEMIDYGNFIVYSSEKLEDSNTYKLICYDKMLYAMKDYETLKGKNLINSVEYNNGVNSSGNISYNNTIYLGINDYVECKPNTTYTITFEHDVSTANLYVGYKNESGTFTERVGYQVARTFTTPNNAYSMFFYLNKSGVSFETIGGYVQLEESSTASSYVPYLSYPITIRNYATILADNIGLTFANKYDDFTNYDKTIEKELYIDNEGNNIGYTYRDVLDELAQVSASTICINDNDELEIRYLNSGNGEAIDFEILGDTTQDTTPSRNLLPNTATTTTTNGITFTANEDGTINVSGTATATAYLEYSTFSLSAGTYTLSAGVYVNTLTRIQLVEDTSGRPLLASTQNASSQSFTTTATKNVFLQFRINSGEIINTTFKPQLETGSTATEYVSYTGAVPNPNNPRDVVNKTGNVIVSGSGKNVFDYTTTTFATPRYVNITTENNTITITTTETTTSNNLFFRTKIPDELLQNGETYTISSVNVSGVARSLKLQLRNKDGSGAGQSMATSVVYNSNYSLYVVENPFASSSSTSIPAGTTAIIKNVQVEKGSTATEYEPYYTTNYPIDLGNLELCKIGTYQDRLFKTTGKNLFDKDDTNNTNGYLKNDGTVQTNSSFTTSDYIDVSQFSNITISGNSGSSELYCFYNESKTFISANGTGTSTTITTSIPNNAKYIRATIKNTNLNQYMVESGSTATSYEPYGNYWYKYNAVGKAIVELTSNIGTLGNQNKYIPFVPPNKAQIYGNSCFCNRAYYSTNTSDSKDGSYYQNNPNFVFVGNSTDTKDTMKEKYDGSLLYYALATPTYERITGDLEKQLNNVRQLELIDAEYLKDINVNFGEEVKPINTITLKRSADSDVISLSSPEDLEDDLKNEIVISENQILNGDDRDDYMQPILARLYGISYSLNDYTSTGITWLELCDRYNVLITKTDDEGNAIESNVYNCVMFNDEINVNQGLQETIHTDRPEESTTDYNTTTRTDRLEKRTSLVVNKQEGYIEALTGELGMVDGESQVIEGIKTTQTQNSLDIEAITSYEEIDGVRTLTGVKTSKGFTFNSKGLIIESSENTYRAVHNETGDYYYDGETPLGETTNEGSKFKNMDLYGEFRYGKDEIGETPMFVGMLFEDNGEECFGHFFNGRESE